MSERKKQPLFETFYVFINNLVVSYLQNTEITLESNQNDPMIVLG